MTFLIPAARIAGPPITAKLKGDDGPATLVPIPVRTHAAARARPARTVSAMERNILAPSLLARRTSDARSGCGIKPKTFPSRLQMPAMFSMEPLGFDSGVVAPVASQ